MYLISNSQRDEMLQRLDELSAVCRACRNGDTLRRCGLLAKSLSKCAQVDNKTAKRIIAESAPLATQILRVDKLTNRDQIVGEAQNSLKITHQTTTK